MIDLIIFIIAVVYLIFGALIATAYCLLDNGTSGRPINPFIWVLITVGWFPILVYKIGEFLWLFFNPYS